MLCGLFNCGGGRADEVEAFGRLERHAGSAGLVVRGPLAVAQSSRAGGMAEYDGVSCFIDGHLYNAGMLACELGMQAADPAGIAVRRHRQAGADLLRQLRGSFSLALWDGPRDEGLLSCDLLATRQLFIWRGAGCLLFAGEVHELLALVPSRPGPDPIGFLTWLAGGTCPEGTTLYEGIRRLGPGELIRLGPHSAEPRTYWRPAYAGTLRGSRRELAEGLRDELERSTGRRLTERATGVVLSGGLDSSIVTTFAARTRPPAARLRTYSAVFPGSDHDESPKILELTASLGLEPATFQLQPQGTLRLALEHTKRWEMPLTGAGALIDVAIVAEAARDGAEVVLDGQTGDEVLGFAPYLVADRLTHGRLLSALELTRHWPLGRATTRRDKIWILRELGLKGAAPYRLGRFVTGRRETLAGPPWLRPELRRRYTELEDRWLWKLGQSGPRWWRHLADVLVHAPHRELRLDYLRHRAAAVGAINESPLYDFDLIDHCLRLPPDLAFDSRFNRPLAREAMRGLMPEAVRLQTQKAVFSSFVVEAIKGADAPGIERLLTADDAELGAYVDLDYIRALWHRGQPRASLGSISWGTTAWRLAAAECWLRLQSRSPLLDELLVDPDVPPPGVRAVSPANSTFFPLVTSPRLA